MKATLTAASVAERCYLEQRKKAMITKVTTIYRYCQGWRLISEIGNNF